MGTSVKGNISAACVEIASRALKASACSLICRGARRLMLRPRFSLPSLRSRSFSRTQRAAEEQERKKNGPRQFDFRPMHPLFFSLRVRFHRRGASVWEHGGFRREMSALHAGYVAKWEHHCVEAALHRGGVGTRVFLQLHHFCRDSVAHPVRSAGVEAAVLPLQRTRRVSDSSLVPLLHNPIQALRKEPGRTGSGLAPRCECVSLSIHLLHTLSLCARRIMCTACQRC